jgi:hypothetical protein
MHKQSNTIRMGFNKNGNTYKKKLNRTDGEGDLLRILLEKLSENLRFRL